jgi:hypothetical protein
MLAIDTRMAQTAHRWSLLSARQGAEVACCY